ncbi:MAG TPA: aminotransferase class I/II-fold pyridoxal phosphate-dependent enzyme [Candidatus Omnitrophica bacterium]|nr:aminotransferase class I/II-fold pyridoxal phosphate-dependent enzyme [Candidatus Omnitrophota bacterium]
MAELSKRVQSLVEYPFAELDRKKKEVLKKGMEVIDLGVGDPDTPPLQTLIEKLCELAKKQNIHQYPSYKGREELRSAVAEWYRKRFGVKLDYENEVLILIGAKEGIGHIPLAFVNPGEYVLVPDPGYPVYRSGTLLANGVPVVMPLREGNNFLPDLSILHEKSSILKKCRMMYLNYPNNPTSAVADECFFQEVIDFASRHNIIVCHDATYSEITYEGYRAKSFLETDGAKDIGVEFHSLSKSCNMTGWRIGFVVGNKEIIAGLGKVKTNLDSGVFNLIQLTAIEAIKTMPENLEKILPLYKERRDILLEALAGAGLKVNKPLATFYLWISVPNRMKSADFCSKMLEECGVLVTPGSGFGSEGEGYFRISLTTPTSRIEEAAERIKRLKI